MLTYPHIDPVALALGPIKIHWYGIMYLLAFFWPGMWVYSALKNLTLGMPRKSLI